MSAGDSLSPQQFLFHGTRHTFKPGQILEGGVHQANQGYGQPDEHVYASEDPFVAHDFAEAGYGPKRNPDARPKVYLVRPVEGHPVEPDPHEEEKFKSFRAQRFEVVKRMPRLG